MRVKSAALLLGAALLVAGCGQPASSGDTVTIAVATSLRRVLPQLVQAYERVRGEGPALVATYGASGTLRQQVEAGAPIDLVLVAGSADVDRLVERGLADGTTRAVVARNAIVLIGRRGAAPRTFETLDELPEGERIAIGDPASVPAGRYAKQALEALGSWEALAPRFVYGMDVAAVLAYVRRGEVAAGIVYRTETSGVEDVVVLDQARPPWAPTPEVVAAAVRDARQARDARDFLDFLQGPIARGILADHGFLPP